MQAGKLRHKLIIQQQTPTKNEHKEDIITYTTFKEVYGDIQIGQGKEFYYASKVNAEITGAIKIRYLQGVNPTMRIQFGSRYFDILSVIDVGERTREMILGVREVVM